MNPNIKCTCPFGNPAVAIVENCPVHGVGIESIIYKYPCIWHNGNNYLKMSDVILIANERMEKQTEKLLLDHLKQLNTLAKQSIIVKEQYENNIAELVKQIAFRDEEIKMLKHLHHE